MIDLEHVRRLVLSRLHAKYVWDFRPRFTLSFSRACNALRQLTLSDVVGVSAIPAKWTGFFPFGEEELAGGASLFLGVAVGGEIYALDVEAVDQGLRFVNSSTERFISSVLSLDRILSGVDGDKLDAGLAVLRSIEPERFAESDWESILRYGAKSRART